MSLELGRCAGFSRHRSFCHLVDVACRVLSVKDLERLDRVTCGRTEPFVPHFLG